jgi:hypothetical protein
LLEALGFVIKLEKYVLKPHQIMEFSGLTIYSVRFTLSPPVKKQSQIINVCKRALSSTQVSVHDLASILGLFSWASLVVDFAQSHYRHLQRQYNSGLFMGQGDMRVKLALSPESREYLSWWVCSLSYLGGKSMLEQSPVLVICSNDSLSGWGGGQFVEKSLRLDHGQERTLKGT